MISGWAKWELTWKDTEGKDERGTNTINKILGGCTIEENFTREDGTFSGKSFSVYNPNKGIWEQTWVDNAGGYMTFTGGMSDDKMTLGREVITKDGRKIMQRMTFFDIKPDAFTWDWERSLDNGQTWDLIWRINYKRIN